MLTETVRVDWVQDRVFLLRDRLDFPVVMTQPQGVLGADLLPLSLIGCFAWDVMNILQKQRVPVTGLRVFADSERDAEPPWRFRKIHMRFEFRGTHLDRERVERAFALSEKYCSVYVTLRDAVQIDSEIEILDG